MKYFEAIAYREKNLHLIGQDYQGNKIKEITIYPREESLLNEFLSIYITNNFDPKFPATLFDSENYGLLIHCVEPTVEFAYCDISDLGTAYKIELPEGY
ncbi:hypothetical protein MM236_01200 [Belliella sp. DSM 107340]|uniref:Uncharacterized protein n=1 Tax=Belliella calami TaxID=2923436 RepID=A0ABS9UK23_9BACT|nr:hypothetical protein [Belliella calami]MCH7396578.1 hypothetical protein [Belliella calami]